MGAYVGGVKAKGIYFSGNSYGGGTANLQPIASMSNAIVGVSASVASSETSGYKLTYTPLSSSFEMYSQDDLFTPLTSLPTHKIILATSSVTETNAFTLSYSGNGLFTLSGSLDVIAKAKISPAVFIAVVDSQNRPFLTSSSATKFDFTSASVTQNYDAGTITYSRSDISSYHEPFPISFPYDTQNLPTSKKLTTLSSSSGDIITGDNVAISYKFA